VTLGDLRAGLRVSPRTLARALGLSAVGLAKLEATPVQWVSVGALVSYAAGLGARVEIAFADGVRVAVKP
jgi:hypothetical protein